MESFVKWGQEKRQLHEIVGTLAVTAGAISAAHYLWQKAMQRKEQRGMFKVFKRDTKEESQLTGIEVVQMIRTGVLKWSDWIFPDGAQNWKTIKDAKKYLPFKEVTKGNARDDTVWLAWINKKQVKFANSTDFAKAIAKGLIEDNTMIFRNGYDGWMPYKSKDVQDDMTPYVEKEAPGLGDKDLLAAKTYYGIKNKKYGPIKFEDLVDLFMNKQINDESWVWVAGFSEKWVKFKEVKKKLPRIGQASEVNPRGILGKAGQFLKNAVNKDVNQNSPTNDDKYLRDRDNIDRYKP